MGVQKEEMAIETRLLNEAAVEDGWPVPSVRPEDRAATLATIDRPDWSQTKSIGDWRRWTPDVVKELWNNLSLESKLIAFIMASGIACRAADDYFDARDRDR